MAASQDWLDKDFYAVLGVSKDVSAADLKKEYRKLARKYHPDANPGDAEAEERFKAISEAYSVLSDPKQRKEYDALRAMGGGARFTSAPGGSGGFEDVFGGMFGGGPGGTRVRFQTNNGAGGPDLDDLLGGIFGAAGGAGASGGYGASPRARGGRDIRVSARLSFDQAVRGTTVELAVPGAGRVRTRIPAGVRDGQTIRVRGKGSPGVAGGPAGDLLVRIQVSKHPVFERDGDDLRVVVPVTFTEAALGATIEAPTYGGGRVKLRVRPGTPSGRVLRVRGRGVHTAKRTGDLLVEVEVAVPQKLSGTQRSAVKSLAKAFEDEDPRADLYRRASAAEPAA